MFRLVLVLRVAVIFIAFFASCLVYSQSKGSRVDVEEAMREFNARYMYLNATDLNSDGTIDESEIAKAKHVSWPKCDGCSGYGPVVAKPSDEYYGDRMEDPHYAVVRVRALVGAFYGQNKIYPSFLKVEAETGGSFVYYTQDDFPRSWESEAGEGVTVDNCRQAANVILGYIKQLDTTDYGPSLSWVNKESRFATSDTDEDNAHTEPYVSSMCEASELARKELIGIEAMPDYPTSWQQTSWEPTIYLPGAYRGHYGGRLWSTKSENYGETISYGVMSNFYVKRAKLTTSLVNVADKEVSVYLKVKAEATNGDDILPGAPVAHDDQWHKWITINGSGQWASEYIGDVEEPEPVPGCAVEGDGIISSNWYISGYRATVSPVWNSEPDPGTCDEPCDSGDCSSSTGSSYSVSSLGASFSLGRLGGENHAGRLYLHASKPSQWIVTPDLLRLSLDENIDDELDHVIRLSDRRLRQVYTGEMLVDIVTNQEDSSVAEEKYEIRYYQLDQLAGQRDSNGLYLIQSGEMPIKRIVVQDMDGVSLENYNVRFTEYGDTGAINLVNEFVWTPDSLAFNGGYWSLYEGLDKTSPSIVSYLRRTSVYEQMNDEYDLRTKIKSIYSPDGSLASQVKETKKQFPFGWKLVERVISPQLSGHEIRTETWEYYDDPNAAMYGNKKSYVTGLGYWEVYGYDLNTGRLDQKILQLGDNPYDRDSLFSDLKLNNISIDYNELNIDLDDLDLEIELIREKITKVEGQVVGSEYEIFWSELIDIDGVLYEDKWEIASPVRDPALGFSSTVAFLNALHSSDNHLGHLVTKKRKVAYEDSQGQVQDNALRLVRNILPDGKVVILEYPQIGEKIVASGYVDSQILDPMDVDDIIFGEKEIELTTDEGYLDRSIKYVRDPDAADSNGQWMMCSLKETESVDLFGRPLETRYYFGDQALLQVNSQNGQFSYRTSKTYGCCNIDSETDRYGLTTYYTYDDLGRKILRVDPAGISTYYTHDGAGNVKLVEREGAESQTVVLNKLLVHDEAGRIIKESDGLGRNKYYCYRLVGEDGEEYDAQVHSSYYEEVRTYPHSNSSGPIEVVWFDSHRRVVRSWQGATAENWNVANPPHGGELLVELRRELFYYDWAGRISESKQYFALDSLSGLMDIGNRNEHYILKSGSIYDSIGRKIKSQDLDGNITVDIYDLNGNSIETWFGTEDSSPIELEELFDPSALDSDSNLVSIQREIYDNYSRLIEVEVLSSATALSQFVSTISIESYESIQTGDAILYRIEKIIPPLGPSSKKVFDAQGRLVINDSVSNDGVTLLGRSQYYYDDENSTLPVEYEDSDSLSTGRLVAERIYEVTAGSVQSYIESKFLYDSAGRKFCTISSRDVYEMSIYDEHGRLNTILTGIDNSQTPFDLTDDIVLTQILYGYDLADQNITLVTYDRKPDDTFSLGLLSDLTELGVDVAELNYFAKWYDDAGRIIRTADYGNGNGFDPNP